MGRVGYGVGYRGNAPGHHFGLPTISKETVHAAKPAPKEEAPKEEAPKEVKKVVIHGHHGPHAFGHHGFDGFGPHGMGHRGYGVGYRGNAPGHHFGLPTISKETVHADKPAKEEDWKAPAPKKEAPKEVKEVVVHGHHAW